MLDYIAEKLQPSGKSLETWVKLNEAVVMQSHKW